MAHSYIAVWNMSTIVGDADAAVMTRAVSTQLRLHAAPLWQKIPPVVNFHKHDPAPPGAWPLYILDDPDTAGALGYHDLDPQGNPYARIFVKPTLQAGGHTLHPNGTSPGLTVSSVLSHEVLEAFCDPYIQLWADKGDGEEIAVEVGDPVEDVSYAVLVTRAGATAAEPVMVSDFVLPRWFDSSAPVGTQLSYCESVHHPFTMTRGGYTIVRSAGQESQQFGELYPEWKKPLKAAAGSRTGRRVRV